jgi:hypothetical protein
MSYEPTFILGDSKAICDVCGFTYKHSQLRKRWDGALVCHQDFEPRHPQDRIPARTERQNIRDARPEPEWVFIGANEVQPGDL